MHATTIVPPARTSAPAVPSPLTRGVYVIEANGRGDIIAVTSAGRLAMAFPFSRASRRWISNARRAAQMILDSTDPIES